MLELFFPCFPFDDSSLSRVVFRIAAKMMPMLERRLMIRTDLVDNATAPEDA